MGRFKSLTSKRKVIAAFIIALAIIAILSALYFYDTYKKAQIASSNPTLAAQKQVEELTTKVGKLIELPSDQIPQVATVSDITKLKDQPFFANAKNGDKVLIFQEAKKAILYRPSINKIIEVAPLNLANTNPTPAGTAAEKTFKVYIYNGTKITGLASTTRKELSAKTTKFEFVGVADAAKKDYTDTLVVDIRVNNKNAAEALAQLAGGKTATLPAGEKAPQDADFLIILGR